MNAAPDPSDEYLIAVLSADIYLKSRRTLGSMIRVVTENLTAALGPGTLVSRAGGHRLRFSTPAEDAAGVAARVFGVTAVERVIPVPFDTVGDLARRIAELAAPSVEGSTFAVRPKRRGKHDWSSYDLACLVGDLLCEAGGTVDLGDPDVRVEARIDGNEAGYVVESVPGQGGLPLRSQDGALVLLSGGIDSPVSAWMMMSRGCPIDFLHFNLDCAQSDHAMAVAYKLWTDWGAGTLPVAHIVDLRPAVAALVDAEKPKMRQVALKALMMRAASAVAEEEGLQALVTGEALGQVSSQTLVHLAALSKESATPLLRPLVGLPKVEIVRRATEIGTFELSSRAREVCDLSTGLPVEVAATPERISASADRVPDDLWRDAVVKRQRFLLTDWVPGMTTDDDAV